MEECTNCKVLDKPGLNRIKNSKKKICKYEHPYYICKKCSSKYIESKVTYYITYTIFLIIIAFLWDLVKIIDNDNIIIKIIIFIVLSLPSFFISQYIGWIIARFKKN